MQQRVDRRAAKDSRVLRWHTTHRSIDDRTEPAWCVSRGATRHTSQKSTAASADMVVGIPASSLVSSSFWCCVLSSGASVSSSSSASEWLSLSIFSEPTWLTACRNCSRAYAWLSNLCKHIFMRLSFVRLTRFLARLMHGQTAGNSADIWHTVDGNIARKTNKLGCGNPR